MKKKSKIYIFNRVYCAFFVLLWNFLGSYELARNIQSGYMVILIPFIIPAMLMIGTWIYHPYEYSSFGPLRRTPFPDEAPVRVIDRSGILIRGFGTTVPFVSWQIFQDGVGFCVIGMGETYMGFDKVKTVEKSFWYGGRIVHNSEEVRSPIYCSQTVCDAISETMPRRQSPSHS